MRLSNLGCNEIVEAVWHSSSTTESSERILQRVEKCGKDLSWWNRNVFGNVRRELEKLRNLLLKAEGVAILSGDNTQVRQLKKDIEVLRDREATMWAQRSRILWARQGDKNTKYLHSCATKRYRKNLIEGVRHGEGIWRAHSEEIAPVFVSYFNTLFSSSGHNGFARVLEFVPNVITDEMNASLSRASEASEVHVALQQMAHGSDGMPPLFYQHFWGTVNQDVTSSILMRLNSSTLPSPINHTFITLIPKINSPKHVHQYYPISHCNMLYKIFPKF